MTWRVGFWAVGLDLGFPVGPFCPFSFSVPLLKPNSRKKGTLISKGLLGNQEILAGSWMALLSNNQHYVGTLRLYILRTSIGAVRNHKYTSFIASPSFYVP